MKEVDLSLSKLTLPKGKVIRRTEILCDYCEQDNFVVEEPGIETTRWLRCHNCDQYYYVTHGIMCTNVIFVSPGITKDPWAKKVQPSFEKAPLSKEIIEKELME